jgi:two-component system, OmpR family, KDP operon response regulator KdpE
VKILAVEDDLGILEVLKLCFDMRWPGTETLTTTSGNQAIQMVETESPDIVILDLGLPDIDGLDVLKEIRLFSDVPVIILTARTNEASVVKGLEFGADDYILKPFSHIEMLARVRAVMRRTHMPELKGGEKPVRDGNLTIDFASKEVKQGGKIVELTPTEWRMLTELVRNENRGLSYETLLRRVWGDDYVNDTDYIKKYIYRLRQKLGDDPQSPRLIVSVRGMGYKFLRSA